jgi:NAD(P)-dependent dehydrogenase (short-subunit alcohol dehydrogenase family)
VSSAVVFVTGASRGIGRAVAEAFASDGATVVGAARDQTTLDDVASVCGDAFHPVVVDVSDEAACAESIAACEHDHGRIDVLVHSAGIAESRRFVDTTTDLWRRIMTVDVEAPFWLTRAALPGMLERKSGTVITIGSLSAKVGYRYVAAYTAAKHALLGLTRALAAEFPTSGVTFNCVCPWFVDTEMTATTVKNIAEQARIPGEQALALLLTPQKRLIRPEEVAAVCRFLATPAARGITGQSINIDGGLRQD